MTAVFPRQPFLVSAGTIALLLACGLDAQESRPDLSGVWSTTMTTPNDEAWRMEDFACF